MRMLYGLIAVFKDLPIKYKIHGIYLPLIIIPLLILGLVSNQISSQIIIRKTIKNSLDESVLISSRIEMIFNSIENSADYIARNLNNIPDIFELCKDEICALKRKNTIMDELAFAISSNVENVIFVDSHGINYCTSSSIEEKDRQIIFNDCIKEVKKTRGENIWFPLKERALLQKDDSELTLILGKRILSRNSLKELGILFITIKESSISDIYHNIGPISGNRYFIVNDSGMIVSSGDKNKLLKPLKDEYIKYLKFEDKVITEIIHNEEGTFLLTNVPIKHLRLHLLNEIPLQELTSDSNKVSLIIAVIGIICLLFALSGARVLANVISKPILQLTEKMLDVKNGNFDGGYSYNSRDEIGILASSFNTMLAKIKELMAKIEREQDKKREYEFALMQAQIKPHFLYNTLDLIYILCSMGRNTEARETTKALADFYKIVLSHGREVITIREEMKNINNYLIIQKARYSEVFDYRINISNDILDNCIPKLTIQPVVENAIYHGLRPKGSLGSILIEGFVEEDQNVIKIIDDGVGVEPYKLKHLLEKNQNINTSFGLTNVNERLKLYFGNEYGIAIDSEFGKGTSITVMLPRKYIEEYGQEILYDKKI